MNRRGLILGAGAGLAGILAPGGWAPAAAGSGVLMPIKRLVAPAQRIVRWIVQPVQGGFKGVDGDTLTIHSEIILDGEFRIPVSATMPLRAGRAYRPVSLRVPIFDDATIGPAEIECDTLDIL